MSGRNSFEGEIEGNPLLSEWMMSTRIAISETDNDTAL